MTRGARSARSAGATGVSRSTESTRSLEGRGIMQISVGRGSFVFTGWVGGFPNESKRDTT